MKFSTILYGLAVFGVLALAGDNCCSGNKWQAESASQKQDTLWSKIVANQNPGGWPGLNMGVLLIESMDPTFDHVADDMPNFRQKLIHSVGNVAKAKWVPRSHNNYTGVLFESDYAFVRLSLAAKPDPSISTQAECQPQCGFTPGMSMKFMRDGIDSANLVSMFSLVGQPSFNFFANNFTNHPPLDCADVYGSFRLLYDRFATASQWPTTVGLSDMAHHDQKGNDLKPKFPFQLILTPNPTFVNKFPDAPTSDPDTTLAKQLQTITPGSVLWTVSAISSPGARPVVIADIETVSTFVRSNWGDRFMFNEHTRMEDDVALHPEWKSHLPALC